MCLLISSNQHCGEDFKGSRVTFYRVARLIRVLPNVLINFWSAYYQTYPKQPCKVSALWIRNHLLGDKIYFRKFEKKTNESQNRLNRA